MDPVVKNPVWPWQAHQGFPWDGIQYFKGPEGLVTDAGPLFSDWHLAYEEWGPPKGIPVVIFHALTGDSHVARHTPDGSPGWWDGVVGPDMGLNTKTHRVLCFNVLGGAMGSTGPSSLDSMGQPWGSRFPVLSLFDMARAAHALVSAWNPGPVIIIGGSMGGMLAYAYTALFPGHVAALMAVGAPIQHEPWAIAYHTVGQAAILHDRHFRGGDYYDGPFPDEGLAIARMADMISYQHPQSMARKFGRRRQTPHMDQFAVTSYLGYQGRKLVGRFDANTYLTLTRAMDDFSLAPQQIASLKGTLIWMVGIESDLLYLPEEIQAHHDILAAAGVPTRLSWLKGPWGHDTFLVEQDQMGALVSQFLQTAGS